MTISFSSTMLWHQRSCSIQGSDNALDQIQCVKYTLHPTFPNPEREVCKRGTGERNR